MMRPLQITYFYRGKTYAIDMELSTEHGNTATDIV
jgi:hypothetical protein